MYDYLCDTFFRYAIFFRVYINFSFSFFSSTLKVFLEKMMCYSKISLKWTPSGPKKSVHYNEVFIIERCISSKNRFFGLFKSVHYEEVFTMERCSLTEVLLYINIHIIFILTPNSWSCVVNNLCSSVEENSLRMASSSSK
jgi:hypothetical protein